MLTPESATLPAAERKMVGSVFVCEAESLEEVRALMESDVYYTSGVVSRVFRLCFAFRLVRWDLADERGQWDKEKLVILPIALATPLP